MKFIPVPSFDKLNAGLTSIESQGCYATAKLEAFSCRNTKAERRIQTGIVTNRIQREHERQEHFKTQQQIIMAMTPPMAPQDSPSSFDSRPSGAVSFSLDNYNAAGVGSGFSPSGPRDDDDFRLDEDGGAGGSGGDLDSGNLQGRSSWREDYPLPYCGPISSVPYAHSPSPPMSYIRNYNSSTFPSVLPSSQMGSRVQSMNPQGETPSPTTNESTIDDVDNRLVLLVGTLNAIHGALDFDFTCLETSDFLMLAPLEFFEKVNEFLSSLPREVLANTVGSINGEHFWGAIAALVGGDNMLVDLRTGTSDCEFFQFACPQCDPVAQSKVWSNHFFIYNKRHHVVISLLMFGEGNMYRGDSGVPRIGSYLSGTSTPMNELEDEVYGGSEAKNASYFGFRGDP